MTSTDPAGGSGTWTVADIDGKQAITSVSCASVSLCVAIDHNGNALVSTNPTGGAAAWSTTAVDTITGSKAVTSISCVSGPLCVVADNAGNVVTSTDPTGGVGAWTTSNIDAGNSVEDVSCASTSLCVAVDGAGNVLSATSPAAGAGAWAGSHVNGGGPIVDVSCTSAPLCVAGATTQRGQTPSIVLTSTNPTGGVSAWTATSSPLNSGGVADIGGGVSCTAESLCVALAGGNGGLWQSGEPAAGAAAWANENPDITFLDSVACATRSFCVIGDGEGNVVTSIETRALSVSLHGTGAGWVHATGIRCPFTSCTHPVPPGMLVPPPITAVGCGNPFGPPLGSGICALGYPIGNEVTLQAEPVTGSVFTGWSGPCSGSVSSCTLTMSADQPVSASFTRASLLVPTISSLSETAKAWREGKALAHITASQASNVSRRKLPLGTTFSFSLNVPARITLAFNQRASGRKVGRRCLAQTKQHPGKHRCIRAVTAGTLTLSAHAGTNRVRFEGFISRHRKLKPGNYTLVATAAGEHSSTPTLRFTIAKS